MKTLCITGSCQSDLNFVHSLLTQAGMGEALSSSRDPSLTVDFWHQEVMSRLDQLTNQVGEIELGRVWEQLASDLFISNLDQPIWGWANPQSLALLDFWQAFDPQVRFVLVSCSVQRHVAHAIVAGEPVDSLNTLIGRWVTEQFQMLNFYHRYPDKTLLIDMDHCIDQPAGLIKAMHQTWQIGLKKVHFPVQSAPQFPPLVRYLVEQVCETDHQWQSLQNELMSSVTPIGTLWKTPRSISIKEAINVVFETEQEKNELRLMLKENEREVEQRRQAVSVLEHQLHVKEEEYADILSQFDEVNKQLNQKKRALEESLNQAHFQSHQPDDSQIKTLNDRIQQLTEENHSLTNGLKDAQEEGELILLQLHQVQEELENYFLKYKDCENALELSNQRWKRLLSRMPDYFDLGHVSVSMVGHESEQRLLWQFRDLEAAGRTLRDLTVVSFVEGEVAGLEFMREAGEQPVFLRWPVVVKDDDRLTIAVMGDAKTGVKRLETLMQVGRSDWDLIQVVIAALIQALQQPDHLDLPASFSVDTTLSGLKELQSRLKSMPPVLRFDEIML